MPRSHLATLADMAVMKATDEKQAAQMISDRIEQDGIPTEVSMAEVKTDNHWVVIVPAEYTNYDNSFRKIAVVPDMTPGSEFKNNHIGIITPEDGRVKDRLE